MQNILIVGAGKSSGVLIEYLSKHSLSDQYRVTVADNHPPHLDFIFSKSLPVELLKISDVEDTILHEAIFKSTLVISMLPASLHIHIARKCLEAKKHLITPSYISPEMQLLHQPAQKEGLIFLNEMGLDPGTDHMSACDMIFKIQEEGGVVESFLSHCGGLIAPESNDNPWGYKFSWNPRNVVLAGQGNGCIRWKENGRIQLLPYHRLFASTKKVSVGSEEFDSYPNRDSLTFIEPYHLQTAKTVYRGTLRYRGFCEAWNFLVHLGLCDDATPIELNENDTCLEFLLRFIPGAGKYNIEEKTAELLKTTVTSESFKRFKWLGFFEEEKLMLSGTYTAAAVLQKILEKKWQLLPGDRDRVIMLHEMTYQLHGKRFLTTSLLDKRGSSQHTAMAETVGLPIGIAAQMILSKRWKITGVIRPVYREIYQPVLEALEKHGIKFTHAQKEISCFSG
jgi:saccharopine dehydrogenase-like NADP-dependent oxidoreductase